MNHPLLKSRGFSLVETTIALGIGSFALTSIFALLPIGLNLSRGAVEQTVANGILTDVVADLRATPPTATQSERFGIAIPATGTTTAAPLYFDREGRATTTPVGNSRHRLNVSFVPGDSTNAPLRVALQIGWPAAVTPSEATGSVKTLITLGQLR
jgi:uncharacterized protein (TIGR02598 family)